MTLSSNGLPANRESELRDCLALIRAGQAALQMRDGVTLHECQVASRQADYLIQCAYARYREWKA